MSKLITEIQDGDYMIEVELSGGSGRASITTPTKMTVSEGKATADIEWSSSNYDYMIVDEVTYDPVNQEDHSLFQIPVSELDVPLDIIADTTAMSVPHEVSYTLYFDSYSMTPIADQGFRTLPFFAGGMIVLGIVFAGIWMVGKRKKQDASR